MKHTFWTYNPPEWPPQMIKLFPTKKAAQADFEKHFPKEFKSFRWMAKQGGMKIRKVTVEWQ